MRQALKRWLARGRAALVGPSPEPAPPPPQVVSLRAEVFEASRDRAAADPHAEELAARLAAFEASHREVVARHQEIAARHDEVKALHAAVTRARAAASPELVARLSASVRWLAEQVGRDPGPPAPPAGPLVSVVMPVWDRAGTVADAVRSVLAQTYAHWELLIADDGSTDGTAAAVAPFLADGRVRLLPGDHAGACAARNRALAAARGEVVAYLDSDNAWFPGCLAAVVRAFADHPGRDAVYTAQLVEDAADGSAYVRAEPFDAGRLARANFIDLNAYAHRRSLYERHGGFDEQLTAGEDWDFVLRHAAAGAEPLAVPALGGRYRANGPDSVTARQSPWLNLYRIRSKHDRPPADAPAVLVVGDDPAARAELACLRRWGVSVGAWAGADALTRSRPDAVHALGVAAALEVAPACAAAGVRLTVRAFAATADEVNQLHRSPAVAAVFLPPAVAAVRPGPKVRAMPAAFDGSVYHPRRDFDRALVVGTGRDRAAFDRAAALCPGWYFVWAGGPDERLAHAGVCLHDGPADEPAAVAALACGCLVVSGASVEEMAGRVRATGGWSAAAWAAVRAAGPDAAFRAHADRDVLRPLVEAWRCDGRGERGA